MLALWDGHEPMIIDIHGHLAAPNELYQWKTNLLSARGFGDTTSAGLSDEKVVASAEGLLKTLDSVGTDIQFISPRPFQMMHSEKPGKIVRQWISENNNIIARQVQMFPERLRGIAGLPQVAGEDPSMCLEELERATKELGFVGCLLNPDPYEGLASTPPLGDEYWYPLYLKLVELDVPAVIHAAGCKNGREPYSNHFITEEGIAVVSLANSRVFADFPTLKLVVSHGGGSVPYQIGRWRSNRLRPGGEVAESFDDSLRRMYFDTVLYSKESLELLFKVCGSDRCMFGTEKPGFGSARDPNSGLWLDDLKPVIEGINWLSQDDRRLIFEGNAKSVFSKCQVA